METIIFGIIIILLLVAVIVILLVKKPKDNTSSIQQMGNEQSLRIDNLNSNVQNFTNSNVVQLQNMNAQLNNIYHSIGKIQTMSADVEKLRKVLANVKQRGVFAEVQLNNLLEQTIPGMYEKNVKPNPRSDKIVEFAVKVPSARDNDVVWMPIDSKFPFDKYTYLVEASQTDDQKTVEEARHALISAIDIQATSIKDKYILEPYTTPFAIMYLASEGMYMEAVNDKAGLQDKLARRGIMLAGPSTILALLNALSLGFSSIEINKKAGEIQHMLVNIKQQFQKFDDDINKVQRNISDANKALENTKDRSRKINNALDKIDSSEFDN